MGGCATKPKVSNPETTSRDIPIESNEKEVEDVVVVAETNDNQTIVLEQDDNVKAAGEVDRVKEIVDEEIDQSNKRRSLSHLFKEKNEEENDSTEIEKSKSVVLIKSEEASQNNEKASEEILEDKKIVVLSSSIQEAENSKANNNNNDKVEDLVKENGNENNSKENQIPLAEGKITTDVKESSAQESLPKTDAK